MNYHSISLNDNKYPYYYSLVKYNNEYEKYLKEIKERNPIMAKYIEECAMDPNAIFQSYMIFKNNICVGGIIINPTNPSLKATLDIFEDKFDNKDLISDLINQLVASLKLYFYDKYYLAIQINNTLFSSKIKGIVDIYYINYGNAQNITFYNEQREIIPPLIEEINKTETKLNEWHQSWWHDYGLKNHSCFSDEHDKDLIDALTNGTISLSELFYKVHQLRFGDVQSNNAVRTFTFNDDGNIKFTKHSKSRHGISYEFDYNIKRGKTGFDFKTLPFSNFNLKINETASSTNIKTSNSNIFIDKLQGLTRHTIPINDKLSIVVEIHRNLFNDIERCYIDIRTHKTNGKINGIYALRYRNDYDDIEDLRLEYITRKGYKHDLTYELTTNDMSKVFYSNNEDKMTTMLEIAIPIIIIHLHEKKNLNISLDNLNLTNIINNTQKEVIDFLKQIKGEIPLPTLEEYLNNFIASYDRKEENGISRTLHK